MWFLFLCLASVVVLFLVLVDNTNSLRKTSSEDGLRRSAWLTMVTLWIYRSENGERITCATPIPVDTVPSLCVPHKQEYDRSIIEALGNAGIDISSSDNPSLVFTSIIVEYTRLIKSKRRAALKSARNATAQKGEISYLLLCLHLFLNFFRRVTLTLTLDVNSNNRGKKKVDQFNFTLPNIGRPFMLIWFICIFCIHFSPECVLCNFTIVWYLYLSFLYFVFIFHKNVGLCNFSSIVWYESLHLDLNAIWSRTSRQASER